MRNNRNNADIDITPMIDVVFLLLIFFIVCSAMNRDTAVQLPKAKYGISVNPKTANVLILTGIEDNSSVFVMNGAQKIQCSGSEDERRDEIVQYIQNGIKSGKTDVVIQADRRLYNGEVAKAEAAAASVPGIRLYIVVKD
ncbi:hypothetical protein FACS18942_00750 [Planctomycetales bacterium]|nr:hypothetical protein FACS18942_00750 [Planctomycetales bacterium]GHT34623.1 hypothetical protein FACS189427_02260 [Planctomycetales bacterium]